MCDCIDKVISKKIFEAMIETIKKQQSDIDELKKRLKRLEEIHERKEKEKHSDAYIYYNYNWDNECRNG